MENKKLTALEALKEIKKYSKVVANSEELNIVENALKNYEELLKIDCQQNTINDFYPNTKSMIDDLLDLVCSKMGDFLKEGKTYTRTGILEILGSAIRYVNTFAYGKEFNETEKVGVNAKKLKALEIIKDKTSIDLLEELNDDEPYWLDIVCSTKLTKEEYDLLKEALL